MIIPLFAIIIDWIIGDPVHFPHPVRLMGWVISTEEKWIRKHVKSRKGLRFAGLIMVLVNVGLGLGLPLLLFHLFVSNKYLLFIVKTHLAFTLIAAKSLGKEANNVKEELKISLERGRKRLSYIVGRNTEKLNPHGIIRATVETVAENTSDGVIAPLFYMLFGVEFAFLYKFINTMDSMIGYKNERYRDLGFFAAKLDDLVNLIPARLTSLLMIFSSIFKFDVKNGIRITVRDHKKHSSPNAGYPESTVAGLLGITLGGGSFYENIYVEKPIIGDSLRTIRAKDIDDSVRIMIRSEVLFFLILFCYTVFVYAGGGSVL